MIAKQTNISKSTVSVWSRDIKLSNELKSKLSANSQKGLQKGLNTIIKKGFIEQKKCTQSALATIQKFNYSNTDQCQLIAALIYWCEGEKNNPTSVRLANSDPKLIKTFLHCLRTGFKINENRLHALLHLHDYHNEIQQKHFWSKITDIPLNQFNKSYNKPHTGNRKHKNYQGCISIRYGEAVVAKKLTALYDALAANIGP